MPKPLVHTVNPDAHLPCTRHPGRSQGRPRVHSPDALDTWLGGLPWKLWTPNSSDTALTQEGLPGITETSECQRELLLDSRE